MVSVQPWLYYLKMWQAFSCCFAIYAALGKGGSAEHAGILPPLQLAALPSLSPASQ